jgi:hypothetical protein
MADKQSGPHRYDFTTAEDLEKQWRSQRRVKRIQSEVIIKGCVGQIDIQLRGKPVPDFQACHRILTECWRRINELEPVDYNGMVTELGLPVRVSNALDESGLIRIAKLCTLSEEEVIERCPNLADGSTELIRTALKGFGWSLRPSIEGMR